MDVREDVTFLSQESNKEPALALEVGCVIDVAIYTKKKPEPNGKASFPLGLRFSFSGCFAAPQSKLCGLPLWCGLRLVNAVFSAEKTSGRVRRCGGAIVCEPPRAVAVNNAAGPDGCAVRGARSAQKKRVETTGASLLASVESTLFFY